MNRLLLIMAKLPLAGSSKTRLHPVLEPAEAAQLAQCFLLDTADLSRRAALQVQGLQVEVAGSPPEARDEFAALLPDLEFVAQRGDGLNVRLDHVLADGFRRGFDQVVAINADSPSLPDDFIIRAFDYLGQPGVDAVFGPAEDGGYYLIGSKAHHPELVRDVTMSTTTVLADTLRIALGAGIKTALLPPWYDVDEPADLLRLRREIADGIPCGEHTTKFVTTKFVTTELPDPHPESS